MGLFDLFKKKEVQKSKDELIKEKYPQVETHKVEKTEFVKTYDFFGFSVQTTLKPKSLQYDPKGIEVKLEDDRLNVYIDGQYVGTGDNTAKKKFIENCQKNWSINSLAIYDGGRAKIKIKYFL